MITTRSWRRRSTFRDPEPRGRFTRSATGLADARLFGRYTVFTRNRPGLTLRLAPFGGLEMPTGANEITNRRGRLPPALQPGSGSWDLGGGVPSFLYLNLESNLIWQDENRRGGTDMPATGGWTWLIGPGLQLVTRRVVIEGALQLPVYQDVGAAGLEKDPSFILSARANI